MSSWLWHAFGTRPCPRCGAEVPVGDLLREAHDCRQEDLEDQAALADAAAGRLLLVEIAEYLRSPDGQARLAFARWCRERGRR